ncbi:hypothetical protein EX30DRAFT_339298 [Ascodesmis nigricans]|uniref:Large ribosomal subunit protein uL6 alpha-beta domain-containing protein n=1 Tax=Ascodesmis nigricans TaxID=341454 RepID=A0A4V3SJ88_9PEZI|nr:hypothetical protein EX30DRAFT_339298 [Ascodesmis nigricans]
MSLPRLRIPLTSVFKPVQFRALSTTPPLLSKIGKTPVTLPPGVTVTESAVYRHGAKEGDRKSTISGPLGTLHLPIPSYLSVFQDPTTRKTSLTVSSPKSREQREMWGRTRALLANHVAGVSEGHVCILRLVGVGYRATVEDRPAAMFPKFIPDAAPQEVKEGEKPKGVSWPIKSVAGGKRQVKSTVDAKGNMKVVNLKVQYAHPVELPVPVGVEASCPVPTRILLQGLDKEVVKQYAAEIRSWRKPEPYKGKGIFVDTETIKLKNRKIK